MTRILALDASADVLAVALSATDNQDHAVWVWQGAGGAQASGQVLPALHALLRAAQLTLNDIDAIAFGQGPGAFTGLRLACSVAQGVAFGVQIPVLPLSSLGLVAQASWLALGHSAPRADQPVQIAIDARMNEVYCASAQARTDDPAFPGRITQWADPAGGPLQPRLLGAHAWLDALPDRSQNTLQPGAEGLIVGNAPQRLADVLPAHSLAQRGWHAPDVALDAITHTDTDTVTALRLDANDQLPRATTTEAARPQPWRALGLAVLAQQQWRLAHKAVHPGDADLSGAQQALLCVPPEQALPLYVRDQVAQTTAEREAVRQAQRDQQDALDKQPPVATPPWVRALTLNDLDALMAIQHQAYAATPWAPPWSRGQFAASLKNEATVLLGEFSGPAPSPQLRGWLLMHTAADSAEVLGLAVAPALQRQGVAKRLLHSALDAARMRGAEALFLEVRASNAAAQALYAAAGFSACGQRKAYYSQPVEDACVLRRAL